MKKIASIAIIIFLIVIVGIVMINNVQKLETDVTKEQTKVGLILNGEKDDKSWGQSHMEALQKTAKKLNLELIYEECVPEDERCIQYMEEMVRQGCKIIVCNSFDYGTYEYHIAEKYPEVYFFHASGILSSKNFTSYFGRIYQMRYLSGIVAGLQTQTNEIGYVAAMNISEVNRGINAFTLGVKAVNSDATVYVAWSNSWTDDNRTGEATEKLIQNHDIDVIAMHTDSQRVLEIAEEKKIYSIGYNIDNNRVYPNTFLTAPIWHWENFYEPHILECLQGKFYGQHYWDGVDTGIVELAPLTGNVVSGAQAKVDEAKQKLEKGGFDVFYGQIKDQNGRIRVQRGENMSDEMMLNNFDWYVEGVVIDE